jgi:hypothetical protein
VVSDDEGASRRALLSSTGAALVSAGAVVIAGCGSSNNNGKPAVQTAAPPVQRADLRILSGLLDLERRTVAAYTAGLPLLSHAHGKLAKQFLAEELQHTGELLSLIKAAGGSDPPRAGSYDLGHPTNDRQVLALLHGLERAQVAAYLNAIPRLKPGPVRAAAATILNSDAQHIALLRLTQGMVPAPSAFVTGDE